MGWPTSTLSVAAVVPFTIVILSVIKQAFQDRSERKGHPPPPGPTPLPLLGNTLSVNSRQPWLTYTEWQAQYGDIIYIRLLDNDVIVLNSIPVATELLEKRSRIYSDRPFIPTSGPYGHDCNIGLARYGEHWRLSRRIFQQTFRAHAAITFRPMQLRRARQLIINIIDDFDQYPFHFSTFSGAVAMSAVYDYEPAPRNDPMISIVDQFLKAAGPGLGPENTALCQAFPFLLHIPDWLPGSWISREAKRAHALMIKMVDTPYEYVQERMKSKDHMNVSMVSDHISRMAKLDGPYRIEYEAALKKSAVTAFLASAETTSSIMMTFTLAMVQNPHVWKHAQAEIDAVVGTDRLPVFDDRPFLPYVDAIIREAFRWRPVTPLGVPHAVTCSDIYEGYYIPKGATVFVNVWAISRNKALYPDADKFMPERFLDAKGTLIKDDPVEFNFGFGRRKCPGRYTADASVWSAVVTMLATLEFNFAQDADGNNVTFEATFTNGITDHPHPFPCRLTPRPHVNKDMLNRMLTG